MTIQLDHLLEALRRLERTHERLARAVPDPVGAERNADTALAEVLDLLKQPGVTTALDRLIPSARDRVLGAASDVDVELAARLDEIIEIETALLRPLNVSKGDLKELHVAFSRAARSDGSLPTETEALAGIIVSVHRSTKQQLSLSRGLGRKEKKRRKRKIGQAITSAIIGTGAVVANVKQPDMFPFSYAFAAQAFHKALCDVVGEAAD